VVKRIKPPPDPPKGRIKAGADSTGSTDGVPPVFCLRHLVEGWKISDCQREDQANFALTAEKLSRLTWQEIRNAPRHGLGTEKIAREAIKSAIPASITEDVQFLAVRFSGMKPMVGFRSREIFHVVWLDPAFRLYDH
jgi:hypothetical protein